MTRTLPVLAGAAVLLTACTTHVVVVPKKASPTSVEGLKPAFVLAGSVVAAAGIVAAGGGNVVAAGGGIVVASGGGNVVASGAGNFALLGIQESPLTSAKVFLANADGTPVAGGASATTDAQGNFSLANVPAGAAVVTVAIKTKAGKDAVLQSLGLAAGTPSPVAVGVASTLVARAMLGGVKGQPGSFDHAAWQSAVDYCQTKLAPGNWPDLADGQAIQTWMTTLEDGDPSFKSTVAKVEGGLKGSN